MIKDVSIVITSKIVPGNGYVIPYSAQTTPHLQHYLSLHGAIESDAFVTYIVPFYEVRIEGGSQYKALRFGLRNRGDNRLPERRPCDAGLSHTRTCTPTFLPHYKPHSFLGQGPPGAWQLLPGQDFLIHEGGDSTRDVVGGSIGCIEIVDGGWRPFQNEIESLAGAKALAIGAARKLKVQIEHAAYPTAVLY